MVHFGCKHRADTVFERMRCAKPWPVGLSGQACGARRRGWHRYDLDLRSRSASVCVIERILRQARIAPEPHLLRGPVLGPANPAARRNVIGPACI